MKETVIRADGQICNVKMLDGGAGTKSFNIQKGGGLVTTLVKHVYEAGREIPDAAEIFEANGAIECIVKDGVDLVREGVSVIFTCSESEAEKLRRGELSVQGKVAVF